MTWFPLSARALRNIDRCLIERIVVALTEPLVQRAAAAELARDADVFLGYGYAHSLGLITTVTGLTAVVVDPGLWDGLDNTDLLAETLRRRSGVGRALIAPLSRALGGLRDGHADAICWAPWEPGPLRAAVRRATR